MVAPRSRATRRTPKQTPISADRSSIATVGFCALDTRQKRLFCSTFLAPLNGVRTPQDPDTIDVAREASTTRSSRARQPRDRRRGARTPGAMTHQRGTLMDNRKHTGSVTIDGLVESIDAHIEDVQFEIERLESARSLLVNGNEVTAEPTKVTRARSAKSPATTDDAADSPVSEEPEPATEPTPDGKPPARNRGRKPRHSRPLLSSQQTSRRATRARR